jgi:putative flippase GtrA
LLRFASITIAGLTVDFTIFSTLANLNQNAGAANFISTGCAVGCTYLLSSRLVFDSPISRSTAALYFAWYAISNFAFSVAIEWLSDQTHTLAIWTKISALPFSFSLNFFASKQIFKLSSK